MALRMRDSRTYRERLQGPWSDFAHHWRWMVYPCLFIGLGKAIFELLHFRTSIEDVPLLLLGGLLLGVSFMSLFVLVLALAVGVETFKWAQDGTEGHWVARRRALRPNESFIIPTWRFRIIAFVPASLTFVAIMTGWTLLALVIPHQSESIADVMDLLLSW